MSSEHIQLPTGDTENLLNHWLNQIPEAVRHSCKLYGYRINIDDFEDLCHDIVIFLIEENCRRLRTFRGQSSARTWIYTVVRHYLIDRLPRKHNSVSLEDAEVSSLSCPPFQYRTMLLKERKETVRRLLCQMPENRRILFDLSILGSSDSEISRLTGIPAHKVRQVRYSLVQKLKFLCNWNGYR
jgi:RNA polymerase sigma factor (sigma-70 family)